MLSEEFTAGGVRASDAKRRLMATQTLDFNFKKEQEFTAHFGSQFLLIGIDP